MSTTPPAAAAAAAAAADRQFERDGGNPERDFAGLAAGSFVASVAGALILIRATLSIARLLSCGRQVGSVIVVVDGGGGGGGDRHLRDKLSPDQRMEIDALRSAAVRRRLRRCRRRASGSDFSEASSSASASSPSSPSSPSSSSPSSYDDEDDEDDEPCCAICHERYVPSDVIVHSSDPARCRHAFHEECMVRWLVSSGWTKSRIVVPIKALLLLRSSGGGGGGGGGGVDGANAEEDDDGDLLDYDLECPCCRQVFVDRMLSLSSSSV